MSRMRLMQADETGVSTLECLYCGATTECAAPYAVAYCDCRYPRADGVDTPRAARPRARAA